MPTLAEFRSDYFSGRLTATGDKDWWWPGEVTVNYPINANPTESGSPGSKAPVAT